jgi:large subunit ribosomal protein L1
MTKLTKNQKFALEKLDKDRLYTLKEASSLVKDMTKTKFDASIDLDVRLGIDPRKSNQMVRGVVSLPHGTGRETRVLVLCTPDKEAEAKKQELILLVLTTCRKIRVVGQIWML